jgi:hypothetical protein
VYRDRFSTTVNRVGPTHTAPWRLVHLAAAHFCGGRAERHSAVQRILIAFICELKKQVCNGLVLLGERQFAISKCAGDALGISNPKATEQGFRLCQQRRPEAFLEHAPSLTGAKSGKASFAGAIASLLSTWRLKWKYIGAAGNLRRAPAAAVGRRHRSPRTKPSPAASLDSANCFPGIQGPAHRLCYFGWGQLGRNMRGDADHFSASIGSVAPDCFEHQEELLRKHGATSLVVDLRNIHPRRVRRYSNRIRSYRGQSPASCGWGRFRFSVGGSHSVVSGAISVDCMSYKDARTKQSQDTRTASIICRTLIHYAELFKDHPGAGLL